MQFLYWIESWRQPFLDQLMLLVTELGGAAIFVVVALSVYWCVDKYLAYYMLSAGLAGMLTNQFLKLSCAVPRPWELDAQFGIVEAARADATGYSWPSGHTQNAVTLFLAPAIYMRRRLLYILALVGVLLVGCSRIYLGVHTPFDVLGALLVGAAVVGGLAVWLLPLPQRARRCFMLWAGLLLLSVVFLLYIELFPHERASAQELVLAAENAWLLVGMLSGLLIGAVLEQRYVHFSTQACLWLQIVKTVPGLLLVVLILKGLPDLLWARQKLWAIWQR